MVNTKLLFMLATAMLVPYNVAAKDAHSSAHVTVSDEVIAHQRAKLAKNTVGKGFGPQAPRDIDSVAGSNTVLFSAAPAHTEMNLCNIHFHKNCRAQRWRIYPVRRQW